MTGTLKPEEILVDHSVPYPEAPEVNHNDPYQEHYRGAKNPELAKKEKRPPYYRPPFEDK